MMDVSALSFMASSDKDNVASFCERVTVGSTAACKAFSFTVTRFERKRREDQWRILRSIFSQLRATIYWVKVGVKSLVSLCFLCQTRSTYFATVATWFSSGSWDLFCWIQREQNVM